MLLEKMNLSKEDFSIYDAGNAKVLVNNKSVNWILLSTEEVAKFKDMLNYEVSGFDELQNKRFIFKLLLGKVLQFSATRESRLIEPKMRVYFSPTFSCNLKCVYCYAEAEMVNKDIQFDTEETYRIIDSFTNDNVAEVVITGGEPLLRKDLFQLVDYIKLQKNKKVSILTNGILINENNIEQFKKFSKVTLSLDASMAEINDITRGKGTYHKIVKAVKLLKEHGVNVGIASVVSKINLGDVPTLLSFVRDELGIAEHNTSIHVAHGRGKASQIECTSLQVKQFRELYLNDYIENDLNTNSSLFQPEIFKNIQREMCGVATAEIFVDEKGNVYPCRLLVGDQYLLGSLLEDSLEKIIADPKTQAFKDCMKVDNIESCSQCKSKYMCGGGCRSSHACYTGDISKSHAPLCEMIEREIENSILLQSNINPLTREEIQGGRQ